mgnify:FL=1
MREFNIIPHGAGKNFLGAIQDVIKGVETVQHIEKAIKGNNLFDGVYTPFNFNPDWYDRTNWNKELLECHNIWEKCLNKTYQKQQAKKDIIDRLNTCYKGTFHLNYSLPSISQYGIICILNSLEQRVELDRLAQIKKFNNPFDENCAKECRLIHSWEHANMASYKADFVYDYSSVFHELDPRVITEIVERTEETFKVESPVTIADVTSLIAQYNRRNHEILANE